MSISVGARIRERIKAFIVTTRRSAIRGYWILRWTIQARSFHDLLTRATHMVKGQIPILKSGYELSTYLGGDPELFLSKRGKIIGSERVIPEKGLPASPNSIHVPVVRDGVQVEIVLPAFTCRATAGSQLATAIRNLHLKLLNDHRDVRLDFNQVIEVSEEELAGLSEKSRILGCAPSLNIYEPDRVLDVPPEKLRMRSAGGHIHIGMNGFRGNRIENFYDYVKPKRTKGQPAHPMLDDPTRMVQALDVIIGNTMVLLDTNPQAAERRLVYGRAGEYRLPLHGIEYRVLSNFWLRAYPLASLVWGLARMTAALVFYSSQGSEIQERKKDPYGYCNQVPTGCFNPPEWDGIKELLDQIDIAKVQEAINTNNQALARETWEVVKSFIGTHTAGVGEGISDGALPLLASTLDDFEYFIDKGIDYWFSKDQALIRWLCFTNGHGMGWESFLINNVRPERKKAEEAMSPIKTIKARKRKLKEAA